MYHSFVSEHHDFLQTEPKKKRGETHKIAVQTSFLSNDYAKADIIPDDMILKKIACPLHKAAIQTEHIIGDYISYKTMKDFQKVSEIERKKMILLEKNLDFCVLRSRIDYKSQRDGNENNSIKSGTNGSTCPPYGDISENADIKFTEQEEVIKNECAELGQSFIDFPMIDMRNEFSTHWKRVDDDCEHNSFTLNHAKKFDLNHFKYNFDRYEELRNASLSSVAAFRQTIEEMRANSEYWYETSSANHKEIRESFETEYNLRKKKKVKPSDVRHLFFTSTDADPVSVVFQDTDIQSKYGSQIITETLGIDSRLLDASRFANLDCPPICIPSITRTGPADFHCVYFESPNAMGQLTNWVTIIVVRESERKEYVKRYASPHTFIVSLEKRREKKILKGIANTSGYSAGDSKYYCWRIANWLHTLWKTPDNRRRCVIMDDQVSPFGHQVPVFTANADFLGPKSKEYKYYKDNSNNNQYQFRTTLFDKRGHNLMYSGNSRWYLTHAATFMYMDRVCDVMEAAIVCMTSGVQKQDFPLSANPKSNVVWFIDLHKMNKALHTGDKHHIECGIHPAYQAGEDLFMHVINKNRKLRSVNCNTIRWRSETSGGGTCGRGGIKPFQPIVKYWELSTILQYGGNAVKLRKVTKMPTKTKGFNKKQIITEIEKVWGADRIMYQYMNNDKCNKQILSIWVKKGNVIYNARIDAEVAIPCYFGDKQIQDSKLSISNAYAPRHIFTNIAMQLLAKCIAAQNIDTKRAKKTSKLSRYIRYPFKECKQGYVYSDQDGDRIYYLSDGNVDVYSRYNIPVDNEYMTPSEFGKLNKDATLTEIGKYSANDVYHKPVKNGNIRYLFEDDNGDTNWHNGVIKSVVRGVYKVKYENDTTTHEHLPGAFSKDKFNEYWTNSNNDDANSKQAEGGPQEPASTRKKSTSIDSDDSSDSSETKATTRRRGTRTRRQAKHKTFQDIGRKYTYTK